MNLTDRVLIEQRGSTVDAAGQPVETWTEVITIWSDVKFLRGLESIKADQDAATVQISIRTRKRSGITTAMRATFDGVVYNIKAVLPQSASMMDLACEVVSS
jgi:SPP1 family predicted phage head-tail adaptor